MDAVQVVSSYLTRRWEKCDNLYCASARSALAKPGQRRALAVLPPQLLTKFGSSSLRSSGSLDTLFGSRNALSRRRLASMLERDPEAALDRFISHTFRHILMHKCHQRGYNEENNLWKFILIFFGDSPERGIRVKTRRGRFAQLSLRDDGCRLPSSRCRSKAADARKCVYTAVRRCLHLKSTILGTRLRPVYLLKLILRVARFLKRKVAQGGAEWIDLDIKRTGNYAKDDLLEAAANFIANVLWHGPHGFPAHVALQTTLCQWRSFRADYVSEMIQIMYSMDQLGTDDKCKSLLKGFKAAVHSNLNERLFILGPPEFQGPNYAPIFRRLYAVFWILNRKRLLSEPTMQFGIDCCIVARTVATGDLERARLAGGLTDVEYVKWVITLVLLLLECASDVKRNTWLVMQIMAQYFHEGGQKCGILRCPLARPCFRCLIDYVEIYRGMHAILNLLSKSTFYPCHVNLVMQLLRNDISTVKATFFKALAFRREGLYSSYDCDDVRVSDVDTGARGSHAAPPCLRYAAHLLRRGCYGVRVYDDAKLRMRQHRVDAVVPFPVYLQLLIAVQNNVNGVKVAHTIETVVKGPNRYTLLDHLAHNRGRRPWLPYTLRTTAAGKLPLQGFMSLLAHMYLRHKGLDDCLSDLVVTDQLNVMQRTQACHLLSKNPGVVALLTPQLVQSLSVDPGDRVWHLLSAATCERLVRERVPYYLACMIHSSRDPMVARKAASFLNLMLSAPRGLVPLNQELQSIVMHGGLLDLAAKLAAVEPDRRLEALRKGIGKINAAVAEAGDVHVFDQSLEYGQRTASKTEPDSITSRAVRSLDPESSRILTSATRAPYMLDFHLDPEGETRYIYKMDDDMRQDTLVVQIKMFFVQIFRKYNLEVYLHPFLVVPYSTALSTLVRVRTEALGDLPSDDAGTDYTGTAQFRIPDLRLGSLRSYVHSDSFDYGNGDDRGQVSPPPSGQSSDLRRDRNTISVSASPLASVVNSRLGPRRPSCVTAGDSLSVLDCVVGNRHTFGGIVGFIKDSVSCHGIGQTYGGTLEDYFLRKFGPRGSPEFDRAMDNFVNSLAGYSLLCYLLQVKDRHNGNLLISREGHILHIDFGFLLGSSPAADVQFEKAPFKLTKDMTDVLGGVGSPCFQRYVSLLVAAFLCVRREATTLVTLVKLLEHSGMACFRRSSVSRLRRRLYLEATPERAARFMLRKIHFALHSKTTLVYDMVQAWQNGIKY